MKAKRKSVKNPRRPATRKNTLSPRFDTTEYEFAHGHKPRGRGSWWFEIRLAPRRWADPVQVRGVMTYTEAKREFAKVAKALGAEDVRVST